MTNQYRLPEGSNQETLTDILSDRFRFEASSPMSEQRVYYDTFDWRIHRRSLALYQIEDRLLLRPTGGDSRDLETALEGPPRFVADLPESALADKLRSVVKVRALLPVAKIRIRSTANRILNRDDKTVARLDLTESSGSHPAAFVTLRPVRGYPRIARKLGEVLSSHAEEATPESDLMTLALGTAGRSPGDHASGLGLDLDLSDDNRSDTAMRAIMRRLQCTMRANEDGIREDIDTEFLHDFRIAVRRTRSALGQVKGIYAADSTEAFRKEFRWVGRRTNLMRDLDVYLLAESTYRAMLPAPMRDDIDPLFVYLRSQRALAHREVVATLDSDRYATLMRDWAELQSLAAAASGGGPNAHVPIGQLASRRIYKRFRRIVRDGERMVDHPEDELLHALRLECKKLRYLLEFFSGLYPPKRVSRLVKQLRRLQNNLGEFVDLSVQQSFLLGTADELTVLDARTRRALVATGFLVEMMARRQREVKAESSDAFRKFASPKNRREYRDLFAGRDPRSSS